MIVQHKKDIPAWSRYASQLLLDEQKHSHFRKSIKHNNDISALTGYASRASRRALAPALCIDICTVACHRYAEHRMAAYFSSAGLALRFSTLRPRERARSSSSSLSMKDFLSVPLSSATVLADSSMNCLELSKETNVRLIDQNFFTCLEEKGPGFNPENIPCAFHVFVGSSQPTRNVAVSMRGKSGAIHL